MIWFTRLIIRSYPYKIKFIEVFARILLPKKYPAISKRYHWVRFNFRDHLMMHDVAIVFVILFCVIDGSGFSDDVDFDLSRIFHFAFDFFGYFSCKKW